MATFIWPPEVQWPPPAHILLNYDVVAPDGVQLSSRRDRRGDIEEESNMQPYLALITPLNGGQPDQGLPPVSPGSPSHPWVPPGAGGGRPDQGLPPFATQLPIIIPGAPPGAPGSPSHPIYLPVYPDQGLPGGGGSGGHPSHPIWGQGGQPDQGLPGGGGGSPSHPIHIPGVPDQGLPEGQPIPDHELPPIPVPPEYQDDLVIGVKQPGSTEWTFTAYDVQPDQGQPAPTPHRRR